MCILVIYDRFASPQTMWGDLIRGRALNRQNTVGLYNESTFKKLIARDLSKNVRIFGSVLHVVCILKKEYSTSEIIFSSPCIYAQKES